MMIKTPSKPVLGSRWLHEPVLGFAGEREHVYTKLGLSRFGPASLGQSEHPSTIRLGYVGSGLSIASAKERLTQFAEGVSGDGTYKLLDFPGVARNRGFFTDLIHSERTQTITLNELKDLKHIRKRADRFPVAVTLVSEKVRLLAQSEQRPQVIILALPDDLLDLLTSVVKQVGGARNFRRAIKAEVMQHGIPTQILLQRVSEAKPGARNVDPPSRVAWNLFTSIFYKGGGIPWKPLGLQEHTCYIGISFHKLLGPDANIRTSIAQAYDDKGVGLVLRGPDFPWDEAKFGRSPHLDAERASQLIQLVLKRYESETGHQPSRVAIHKTSRYWPAEREGIQDALKGVKQFDLVAVAPTSEVRLVRVGKYPPLRGTFFELGDLRYLYTTGYIPALKAYPHGHVPAPLQIADHYGDSSVERIAEEIMILTKMNWNSAGFAGAVPVTVRFSRRVGEILKEMPPGREPQPLLQFYT